MVAGSSGGPTPLGLAWLLSRRWRPASMAYELMRGMGRLGGRPRLGIAATPTANVAHG